MADPMRDVINEAENVIDIWPYVASVPPDDLSGHHVQHECVEHVYRAPDDRFDHVMVMTLTKNVYLVVIVDLIGDCLLGHHLLNLNDAYGLPDPSAGGG